MGKAQTGSWGVSVGMLSHGITVEPPDINRSEVTFVPGPMGPSPLDWPPSRMSVNAAQTVVEQRVSGPYKSLLTYVFALG